MAVRLQALREFDEQIVTSVFVCSLQLCTTDIITQNTEAPGGGYAVFMFFCLYFSDRQTCTD